MYRYMFHCKRCGYHKECATKEDKSIEKKWHKQQGCEMQFIPIKEQWVLTRSELADDMRKERDDLVYHQLSLAYEDEEQYSINKRNTGL